MTHKFKVNRLINRAKDLAFVPIFTRFWAARNNGLVRVYLYHRVDPIGEHSFMDDGGSPTISPDELLADLEFLSWSSLKCSESQLLPGTNSL